MADKDLIRILQEGVDSWNRWRHDNPKIRIDMQEANLEGVDLIGFNLSEASLIGAKLKGAYLNGANLYHADFVRADLRNANLTQTNLSWAHLTRANLSGANLSGSDLLVTEFVETNLSEANLSGARLGSTKFGNTDLSVVKGLDTVVHIGPSNLGIDTIYRSNGNISEVFLRGTGVPDSFINQMSSLVNALQPIQFYSCFISYSTKDEQFARKLYSRMRDEHLRVWFAPEDIQGGQKLHEQIERAIQIHDRLLLVLSEKSMQSEWVMTEIRNARKIEVEEKRRKLFPIRLIDYMAIKKWKCFDAEAGKDLALEVREYFIPDFSNWKDHDSFELAFARLLRDLKAQES